MLEIIGIPALKDNYIWLLHNGVAAVVVDPGDADPVLKLLNAENLALEAILVTHHHQDHQNGITRLLEHSPARVIGPETESITGLTDALKGGERIHLPMAGITMDVIAVPGHTIGHLAYFGHGRLFCGDTLFTGGCGRIFEGTPAQMFASLAQLASLPENTLVYCAHEYTEANLRFALSVEPGNANLLRRTEEVKSLRANGVPTVPSVLSLEKMTNPFLRCREPEIKTSASNRIGDVDDPVEVFAAIRRMKDAF